MYCSPTKNLFGKASRLLRFKVSSIIGVLHRGASLGCFRGLCQSGSFEGCFIGVLQRVVSEGFF